MSYVYGKVASDPSSHQTPHYGYFDGDGDFILRAPLLDSPEESDVKDLDSLLMVPFVKDHSVGTTAEQKIDRVKYLLGQEASTIELHDFVTDEVRRFLGETSEDHFALAGQFSTDEFLDRVAKYEEISGDLCLIFAALAHWGRPDHLATLRKGISRSTGRLENRDGLTAWIELRWYPLILALYSAGIAAVAADRLDSLKTIFMAPVGVVRPGQRERVFVDAAANAILQFNRANLFKQLPGHERHFTPMSEYLFKILQPSLDDLLFLGGGYEDAFDEFEVMFALVTADRWSQRESHLWAPVGRFGWKEQHGESPPLSRLIDFAKSMGVDWAPLGEGFFGGDSKQFNLVADQFKANVSKLGWW